MLFKRIRDLVARTASLETGVFAGIATSTVIGALFSDVAVKSLRGCVTTSPTGESTDVKAGVLGEAIHDSPNAVVAPGHNVGVLGRGDNAGAGLIDYVIGVEGRIDSVVGDITTGAAFTAAFGNNADNAGDVATAIGYYCGPQADDGHLTSKYCFLSTWVGAILRSVGRVEAVGGLVTNGRQIAADGDLTAADSGTTILTFAGQEIDIRVTNALPVGFYCNIVQGDANQFDITTEGTYTLFGKDGLGSSGTYGDVRVSIPSAGVCIVSGDTAA